jgi:hypothetical protein
MSSSSGLAAMTGPTYQIEIQEELGEDWIEWFAPLNLLSGSQGGTILLGPLADQTALYGVLAKMRNLNLTLIAVTRVDRQETSG